MELSCVIVYNSFWLYHKFSYYKKNIVKHIKYVIFDFAFAIRVEMWMAIESSVLVFKGPKFK